MMASYTPSQLGQERGHLLFSQADSCGAVQAGHKLQGQLRSQLRGPASHPVRLCSPGPSSTRTWAQELASPRLQHQSCRPWRTCMHTQITCVLARPTKTRLWGAPRCGLVLVCP